MSGFDLMTTRNIEPSQGNGGHSQAPPAPPDHQRPVGANKSDGGHPHAPGPPDQRSRAGNKVYKSGPLFISSKGIGWTSWKKRWFILTRTSLVFFRSDPSAIPQKESEVNLTLGGIDLNNSGSVDVKADKKLLTVLFPDGRDGRAFTLKAETLEDLFEWKTALEEALAQAPSAALVMGQTGILKNDKTDAADDSSEQLKGRQTVKPLVIGRPILLALEDIDGTPSFLEKALRFIEVHGVKVEGILRQAADVDDVERRVREYEQGKFEFSPQEDAHVIADCVKYVIRELPSSPVPASCCNALVEACRTDRGMRVTAMRSAICETFPEPNRRLLQRILLMMQSVASHKAENRMSSSAVAACMAPLLLRPLLAGDCELENDFNVGGDGSVQLLQAAAAANHAQAIVVTLLEEYDNIFGEGSMSPEPYTDSEVSGSESEELSDDDETFEDDEAMEGSDASVDDDPEHASRSTCNEAGDNKMQSYDPEQRSKSATISNEPEHIIRRPAAWGRSSAKKNLSMESIDATGYEDEIQRLEDTKVDLQNRITEEAKGNAILQESLERRKKFLHERHLAFEQDVARLQDQLQKERELRTVLEAKMSHGPLFFSSTINEKMKAELHEIGQAEADLINLQQKADYLEVQLNHQREYNYSCMHVSCYQPQQTPNHQAKLKDEEDIELIATSRIPERSTRDKGASSTTSALSKLTNRLNFLKERRTQITNELQNLDKGRNSGQPVQTVEKGRGSESRQSLQNLDKSQGSEGQSSEKGRGFDSFQSLQNQEKWAATKGQLVQNMETVRKSDGQPFQNLDKGSRSESVSVLDKGKSESFPSASKGRCGQSRMTPRTFSR